MRLFLLTIGICVCALVGGVSAQTGDSIPVVNLRCPEDIQKGGETVDIYAVLGGVFEQQTYYNWSISKGAIEQGQGTNRIKVVLPTERSSTLTATVEVTGDFVGSVTTTCSFEYEIPPQAEKTDEFAFSTNGDLKMRLDALIVRLQDEPGTQGYIFVFAESPKKNASIQNIIRKQITLRHLDSDLLTLETGEKSAKSVIQFWLVPAGTEKPNPVLTTDPQTKKVPL